MEKHKVEYFYCDPLSLQKSVKVTRIESGNKKSFSQSHLADGKWKLGRAKHNVAPYLFDCWQSSPPQKPIYLVEGEKCADRLISLGLNATTTIGGANNWRSEYTKFFENRVVYIFPDNDEPGEEYALNAAKDIFSVASEIKLVRLPNLKLGEDVFDFLVDHSSHILEEIVQLAPKYDIPQSTRTKSIPVSQIERKTIEWLWAGRIPIGCITMLEGDGGVGKSFLTLNLASRLSKGEQLPDDSNQREPSPTLLFAPEDDANAVIRPRLEAVGADLERIHIFPEGVVLGNEFYKQLEIEIRDKNIRLVIIDPIVAFLNSFIDTSSAESVRSFMKPLHEIAAINECAILIVRHWNKNNLGSASHRGAGSADFRNAARSVLQAIKRENEYFLCHDKSNYGITAKTLKFELNDMALKWLGTSNESADTILNSLRDGLGQVQIAENFLKEALAQSDIASDELFELALSNGLTRPSINRAKTALGIRSKRQNDKWYFEKYVLPNSIIDKQDAQDAQPLT